MSVTRLPPYPPHHLPLASQPQYGHVGHSRYHSKSEVNVSSSSPRFPSYHSSPHSPYPPPSPARQQFPPTHANQAGQAGHASQTSHASTASQGAQPAQTDRAGAGKTANTGHVGQYHHHHSRLPSQQQQTHQPHHAHHAHHAQPPRSPQVPQTPQGSSPLPSASQPRLMPAPPRSPAFVLKAYQTPQPTDRYQPSRGAQRDAKWHARYAERAHLIQQAAAAHTGRPAPPPPPKHGVGTGLNYKQNANVPYSPRYGYGYGHPQTHAQTHAHTQGQVQAQAVARMNAGRPPHGHAHAYAHPHARARRDSMPGMDKVRMEQQAAIAAARRAHTETIMREKVKVENERKIRRIQLQVYVHARRTACLWKDCRAVLNSWALLEKHIFQCHLRHPPTEPCHHHQSQDAAVKVEGGGEKKPQMGVRCNWQNCQQTFTSAKECYQHCLIGHMADNSSRCPFNCLFEGHQFPDLMSHIGRRHPTATPDDFVPGLIHFKPSIPESSHLPELPLLAKIQPTRHTFPSEHSGSGSANLPLPDVIDITEEDEVISGPSVKPSREQPSARTVRMVARGCISSHRPRKDHFEDKKGAGAAIAAIIENSKRVTRAYHMAHPDRLEEGEVPLSAVSVPMTASDAEDAGVELVDIDRSERQAKEVARRERAQDHKLQVEEADEMGRIVDVWGLGVQRPRMKVRLGSDWTTSVASITSVDSVDGEERMREVDSGDEACSDSSSLSRFSGYSGKGSGGDEVKRSERLKRKVMDREKDSESRSASVGRSSTPSKIRKL